MKKCPKCGAAVSGGKFCTECGCKLPEEASQTGNAIVSSPIGSSVNTPDLSSFDLLADMADNCLEQDLAQREAEALAAFEVEKHQNGKYAILALKDRSEMDVVVPSGVEAIGPNAFEGSDVLTVVLPEGLLKIGNRAFAGCEDLEEINFPQSLRVIGDEAFAGCTNLVADMLQEVRIGQNAFKGTAAEQRWEEHRRKCAAEQKAKDEADNLDAEISALETAARNLDWCKKVERVLTTVGTLPEEVRKRAKKIAVPEQLKGEIACIRSAADTDEEIRKLAQAKRQDAAWWEKVETLNQKVEAAVRPYLAEQETLSALLRQAEDDRKREEEEQKQKLEQQRIAEQKAQEEAEKLDEAIGQLDRQPHDQAWCADVERAAATAERLSAMARNMLKNRNILAAYKKESEQIRTAAVLDNQIRQLAAVGEHNEIWCKQVLAREKEATKAVRSLMTEQETLSELVPLAKAGQAKYEEQARKEKARREEQARKDAEAEAARLDDSIDQLSEGTHDLSWCEKVDRVASMARRLSAAVRNSAKNLELLEIYQDKAKLIREAEICDKKIRVLAGDSVRGEDWIHEVLALNSKVDDMLRTFLTEGERLTELVNQAKKKQKSKETAQRWKKFRKKFGQKAKPIWDYVVIFLISALVIGGFVLACKSMFILAIVSEAVALALAALAAFTTDYDLQTLHFVQGAVAILLLFAVLILKWCLG